MELNEEQVSKIIELAGLQIDGEVSVTDITKALIKIEEKLGCNVSMVEDLPMNVKVLIVDDLELSTYQLSTMLKKVKVAPFVVHSKDEALSEIKKQHFDFIFVDLFLPDEEDGLAVMKFANQCRLEDANKKYRIVAISGTDDLELVTDCFNAGVDEFVSKSAKWHEQILKIIVDKNESYIRKNFIRYDINEQTVTYNVKSLAKSEYVDELYNNAFSVMISGVKNIILNLENVQSMPQEFAKFFTELYRKCNEVNGKFILLNPSEPVNEVLEFSCLNEVITIVESTEQAFALLNQ